MFKKPNQNQIVSAGATVGGALVGGMLSNVVVDAIIDNTMTDNVETTNNKRLYINLGVVALSVVAMASVDGKDVTGQSLKGVFAGMAINKGLDAIKNFASDKNVSNSKMRIALGLGCACENQHLNIAYPTPVLNYPSTAPRLDYSKSLDNENTQEIFDIAI